MEGSAAAKLDRATSPNVQENIFTDMARCDLTQEELQELAKAMADDQLELEKLEGEKAPVTKSYASRIESVKSRIREKSGTFRQGWEMRDVDHVEVKDFDRGTCTLSRMDTGEVVKRRKLTTAELESNAARLPISTLYRLLGAELTRMRQERSQQLVEDAGRYNILKAAIVSGDADALNELSGSREKFDAIVDNYGKKLTRSYYAHRKQS